MARKARDISQTQFMVKPEHLGLVEDLAVKMQILCDARTVKGRQVGGSKMLHVTCWGPPQALQMFFFAASQQVQTQETASLAPK